MSAKDIYIVYETTNLINGKYYIGVHRINNSYYLGSGNILKLAINKYGRNNFMRETIQEFTNKQDAYNLEKHIVTNDLINNKNCYNIAIGGNGGDNKKGSNHPLHGSTWSSNQRIIMSERMKGSNNPMFGKKFSDSHIKKLSESHKGSKHTIEHRRRISIANKGKDHHNFGKKGKLSSISKKWVINGKMFYSLTETKSFFGVGDATIGRWCNPKSRYHIPLCYKF